MAVDARIAAKNFVARLGIVGEAAFAALLAPDVETRDDNGKPVPVEGKKAWQRWCREGGGGRHPDRWERNSLTDHDMDLAAAISMHFSENSDIGRDMIRHEETARASVYDSLFLEMQQEYEAFKVWFMENPTRDIYDVYVFEERAVDARKAAKNFVARLGIVGEVAFFALLAPDVETCNDNGVPMPAEVKRAWQRWCRERGGHPDRWESRSLTDYDMDLAAAVSMHFSENSDIGRDMIKHEETARASAYDALFLEMQQEYASFKVWFNEHPSLMA